MLFCIEIAGTLFGLLCVVLVIRRSIWCWPVGLVQVMLFIIIFYNAKLYSDLLLHVIYVGMQIYGWYYWLKHGGEQADGALVVESMSLRQLTAWIAATAAGTLLLGYLMQRWTDAAVPYGDAFTTVASLVAQFLLARKFLENWLFWIVVDVVAIGIYYYKNLQPTTVLYTVFLILAVIGYVSWRRRMSQQQIVQECMV